MSDHRLYRILGVYIRSLDHTYFIHVKREPGFFLRATFYRHFSGTMLRFVLFQNKRTGQGWKGQQLEQRSACVRNTSTPAPSPGRFASTPASWAGHVEHWSSLPWKRKLRSSGSIPSWLQYKSISSCTGDFLFRKITIVPKTPIVQLLLSTIVHLLIVPKNNNCTIVVALCEWSKYRSDGEVTRKSITRNHTRHSSYHGMIESLDSYWIERQQRTLVGAALKQAWSSNRGPQHLPTGVRTLQLTVSNAGTEPPEVSTFCLCSYWNRWQSSQMCQTFSLYGQTTTTTWLARDGAFVGGSGSGCTTVTSCQMGRVLPRRHSQTFGWGVDSHAFCRLWFEAQAGGANCTVVGPIHRQELVDKLPKGVQVNETDIVPYQTTPGNATVSTQSMNSIPTPSSGVAFYWQQRASTSARLCWIFSRPLSQLAWYALTRETMPTESRSLTSSNVHRISDTTTCLVTSTLLSSLNIPNLTHTHRFTIKGH